MSELDAIVGYTYNTDQYCPPCTAYVFGADTESVAEVEAVLDSAAHAMGIDRADEDSYDSAEFPKIITEQMAEHDYGYGADMGCGRCHQPIYPDDPPPDDGDQGWTDTNVRPVLLRFADACDLAAADLEAEAADPRGVLASRGHYHLDEDDLDQFAARKQLAATGARQYAQYLRDLATHGQTSDPAQAVEDADLVTRAAQLGGWLSEGRHDPAGRQRLADAGWFAHIVDAPGWVRHYRLIAQLDDDD